MRMTRIKPNCDKTTDIMKTKSLLTTCYALAFGAQLAAAQGTAFTYQGRLNDGGNAANGNYDLKFSLYDALTGGSLVAVPVTNSPVVISNGAFSVRLDFGGAFTGPARFLELGTRSNGVAATFTVLTPRQELTPTPYAITAENLDGTLAASQLTGTLPAAILSGSYGNALTVTNAANLVGGSGAGLTADADVEVDDEAEFPRARLRQARHRPSSRRPRKAAP